DLDTFAATVIAEDTDWGAISAARTSAAYFTDTNYRDLGTFIDGVVNYASNVNIITAAQAVQTTYASSIVSNHSGPGEGATGLSIYLPAQGGSVSSSYTAANFDLLADTQWDEFLVAFTGSSSTGTDLDGSITDANPAGTLPATISGFVGLDGAENVGGLDVDFYSLSVTTGQQIGFDIDAREMGGSLDSVLRLFDSIGLELDMNDDAYDPDTNQPSYDSYIEYTFTKTETVYIAVSGYSNWNYDPWTIGSGTAGSTGTYDLLIRNLGGPITDVNGTIPTATSLGSAPVLYSAVIGDEPIGDKDVDFYAIDVESNQGLTISVVSGGSGLDAYLKLFTGDGTLLASDDNTNGVDPEINYDFSVPGAGMYYVAVSGVPNTNYDPFVLGSAVSGSTGSYALNVTGYSVHLDFDGVIPRANVIGAPPASVTGSIGDEPAGSLDVDFYAVDIAAGQTVGFDIDAEELGYALDSVLRLFNQYGTELASSDDGTDPDSGFVGSDPYIEYTFADGGTYYVAVSGAPNDVYSPFVEISGVSGDQGDYELHVRHVGAGSDLNGTIPTAVPVGSLPATMVGSIGDEAAGALDVDFYAVDALADQRLGFDIDAEDNGSPLDSMLRLFDNSGTELAMNDDATDPDTGISSYDSYLTYLFSADGTYFVAVSGYYNDMYDPFVEMSGTPGSTGDYELLIREIEPGPQDQVGPDGFGYIGYPVTPEFEDINGTGSAELTPYVDDNYFYLSATDLAGFEFDFYGTTYQDLYVSSNGLITFGSGNSDYTNTNLTTFPSQAAIAPYWDDLVVDSSSDAAVLWEVRGSGDQQRLIIQWNDIRYIAGAGEGQITFQAVLDETNDSMQFNYLDLASLSWHAEGASATVGIKDAGFQSVGEYVLQISIDEGPNAFVGTGLSTRVDLQGPTMPDLYGTIIAYPDPTPDGWYHIDWTVTNGGSGDA
ncbi:MAG: PPC domain-containing protein, partial [Phycisphaerae bacterium]|nr:PPC domain-containing protein [Phycisphaerae bacterium]